MFFHSWRLLVARAVRRRDCGRARRGESCRSGLEIGEFVLERVSADCGFANSAFALCVVDLPAESRDGQTDLVAERTAGRIGRAELHSTQARARRGKAKARQGQGKARQGKLRATQIRTH